MYENIAGEDRVDISPVIALITPGIIDLLMTERGMSVEQAASALYRSRLYAMLEDERTKLWRLGFPLLYDMLSEEMDEGRMTFPEEQS
jgi:hypothetical protein